MGHKPDADAKHLKITTSTRTLVVSASHGLFDADSHPVVAGKVKVGDTLHTAGVVEKIEPVRAKGLIAPITATGTLVVNGVTTSDYGPFAQRIGHGTCCDGTDQVLALGIPLLEHLAPHRGQP